MPVDDKATADALDRMAKDAGYSRPALAFHLREAAKAMRGGLRGTDGYESNGSAKVTAHLRAYGKLTS